MVVANSLDIANCFSREIDTKILWMMQDLDNSEAYAALTGIPILTLMVNVRLSSSTIASTLTVTLCTRNVIRITL